MHLMSTYEMHTVCVRAAMMMMLMTTTTATMATMATMATNRERQRIKPPFALKYLIPFSVCDANFLTYFRERRNLFYSNVCNWVKVKVLLLLPHMDVM